MLSQFTLQLCTSYVMDWQHGLTHCKTDCCVCCSWFVQPTSSCRRCASWKRCSRTFSNPRSFTFIQTRATMCDFVSLWGIIANFWVTVLSDHCMSVCPVLSVCDVCVLWPNGWMDQDETWHGDRPPPRPHCVRLGPCTSPSKKGHSSPPLFGPCLCGQTERLIKMLLGMEIGLGPGDIALDGDPAPVEMGTAPPLFCPCLLWPNGWIDQDATWHWGRHRPRPQLY